LCRHIRQLDLPDTRMSSWSAKLPNDKASALTLSSAGC
jgi:hypothetical protein